MEFYTVYYSKIFSSRNISEIVKQRVSEREKGVGPTPVKALSQGQGQELMDRLPLLGLPPLIEVISNQE
jgi:hypothetical protein